ncbi:cell division protein FtsL [Alteromonas sp. KS69]|jgi:cell division protein FtsL|uniref:Cell division protein FtsL n=2 Tax=Alteromonas TaxID=226 RepID=A0AAW7Z109_9ALTE|nr:MULTISPECIES: cell division protein FtsL [Alteromonas]AMJ91691.1 cell division protein FtsL [Alteromonas sp. Mac2]MBB67700.1 cell division protein FtsL [Rickettsiales bacterium]PHS55671.1 MAG: cell division protein FtsL [Alteromonas sp.]AEF01988.1 cell division protein FtsL [Alteromonas naphthalenivorans]ALM89473.1 Cell division protein FtsL [Alteromonas stellipolaris LMG 21856]|tara:strand:+ start:116 stop:451 length:336 start_codon:yes stop_codon:yes gene_type:complete
MTLGKPDRANTNFSLLLIIVSDLTRNKLRVLLYLAVLLSGMAVILGSHQNRQQVIALEDLMQQKDELDVEWRNLVLEQRALTEHNRIETLVEKQLDMYRPTADDEVVVRLK